MINKKRKIGILTYIVPHRKTYDVICLLKAKGYINIRIYAAPLHYVKKFTPLIEHRPQLLPWMPETKMLCKNFQYEYYEGRLEEIAIDEDEVLLICGAGILSQNFIEKHIIINAHPGYIPNCRGLDAYKWAILEGEPIGVTSHILGEYVDAGEVIERRKLAVNDNDTFHSVAMRVYENEVSMLVEGIEKLNEKHQYIEPYETIVHKRMPHSLEKKLFVKFEEYKKRFGYIGDEYDGSLGFGKK